MLFEQQNRYRVIGSSVQRSRRGLRSSLAPRTRSSNSSRDANKRAAATIPDSRSPHAAAIDRRRSGWENYSVYIKKRGGVEAKGMKRRPLSPLLDRSSGHREARLVREAEDRGRLLGRSLFFDGCPAWGLRAWESGGERDGGQAAQASLGTWERGWRNWSGWWSFEWVGRATMWVAH